VLDSSALLTFLYGEPGQDRLADLFAAASERAALRLHRIHLGEVYYLFYRRGGEPLAEEMLSDVRQLPIILEDRVSPALMREAGRLKASYRLSYADAFAAGLARLRHGTLVSADRREFEPVEAAREVSVSWVR
jgi:predicted nucleic acid-binding protein